MVLSNSGRAHTLHTQDLGSDSGIWASLQAAFVYRSAILGVGLPKEGVPTFGNRVLVRKQGYVSKSEQSFTSKMDEAVFLCWDSSVINGAYVGCISRLGIFTTRKVSAPTPWPNDTIPTWMLLRNPLGSEKIWLSDKGDTSWTTPKAEETLTFEERSCPEYGKDARSEAQLSDFPIDRDWRRVKHGLPTEESMKLLKEGRIGSYRYPADGKLLDDPTSFGFDAPPGTWGKSLKDLSMTSIKILLTLPWTKLR